MIVRQAKEIARQWVLEEGVQTPGIVGAYFNGTVTALPAEAELPPTSDLDLMLVLDGPEPPVKPGKFSYQGVMLEVSYLPAEQVRSAEYVLGQYHLAGSFRYPSVILDPTGRLTDLNTAVGRDFARREWVVRRCQHARDRILSNLESIRADAPFPDQVTAWLFATGVTTHLPLVAGLQNPTVRTRYLAARTLLAQYGKLDFYEELLELLGCATVSQNQARRHLAAMTEAFDAAIPVVRTPFFFAADLSQDARPVAIDGSRDLIERGDHREAVFWLVATYARCQHVFLADAPALAEQFAPGFAALVGDLGIHSFADLRQRAVQARGFLPRLWSETEAIIAANPDVQS